MGLFDSIGSFLFGSYGQAEAQNQALLDQLLAQYRGIDIPGLSDQARGAFGRATEQARGDISQGYGQALGSVGALSTGARLDASARSTAQQGQAQQQLAQRGLYNTTVAPRVSAGIGSMLNRDLANISGQEAGARAGLLTGQANQLAQAALWGGGNIGRSFQQQLAQELQRAGGMGQGLTGFQYQPQPGALAGILQGVGQGFGTGLGGLLGSQFFPGGGGQPNP